MTDLSEYQSLFDVVTNREPEGVIKPFTKSNGTILARIYERLTKASRRRAIDTEFDQTIEAWYRQGVYDTLKALQQELA